MSTVTCLAPGRAAVLDRVRRSPVKPTELLHNLYPEYSYSDVQDAISELLERGCIILSSSRFLEPVDPDCQDVLR
jgi:hypothetical protein